MVCTLLHSSSFSWSILIASFSSSSQASLVLLLNSWNDSNFDFNLLQQQGRTYLLVSTWFKGYTRGKGGIPLGGPLSWTGYTISHFRVLNRVVPINLLLFSPFDHIIFADFVRLHWNTWKGQLTCRLWCFEYSLLGPVMNRVRNYSTFS